MVARVAFEAKQKPGWNMVYIDFYMDFIYLIDMVRCFTQPYKTKDGKLIQNRKKISRHYIKTWFLVDIYSFYPLTYLKQISEWEGGSLDAYEMFFQ